MNESLNQELNLWLGRLALEWAIPKSNVPLHLGRAEVADRIKCYPTFGRAVLQTPIDMAEVESSGKVCWSLGERFDAIRFGEFASNSNSAEAIANLVAEFPPDDADAAHRIDDFLEKCLDRIEPVRGDDEDLVGHGLSAVGTWRVEKPAVMETDNRFYRPSVRQGRMSVLSVARSTEASHGIIHTERFPS